MAYAMSDRFHGQRADQGAGAAVFDGAVHLLHGLPRRTGAAQTASPIPHPFLPDDFGGRRAGRAAGGPGGAAPVPTRFTSCRSAWSPCAFLALVVLRGDRNASLVPAAAPSPCGCWPRSAALADSALGLSQSRALDRRSAASVVETFVKGLACPARISCMTVLCGGPDCRRRLAAAVLLRGARVRGRWLALSGELAGAGAGGIPGPRDRAR